MRAGEAGSTEVYTQAAALYVAMLKNGYADEASEFAEWFLETFDCFRDRMVDPNA